MLFDFAMVYSVGIISAVLQLLLPEFLPNLHSLIRSLTLYSDIFLKFVSESTDGFMP
jgi:hypothetical protein